MDVSLIKNAAAGRWNEIVTSLCGVGHDVLDGTHQPCPRCGGKDRFRAFGDFPDTGGVVCNQCGRFADGLATIGWLTGRPFAEVVTSVCEHLGIEAKSSAAPSGGRKRMAANPDENLVFQPWNDALVALWCQTKEPITPEAVKALGGQLATYRKQYQVIAFPVYGEFLTDRPPVGRIIYSLSGGTLPKFTQGKPVEWVKCKLTAGSAPGLLFNHNAITTRDSFPHTSIKCEGPTDAMAAITLAESLPVWTNANGAGEIPKHWIVELLTAKLVGIIHDADKPGQDGLKVWAANLTKCEKIKTLALPYEIEPTNGKDLRDWVREGNGLTEFQKLFKAGVTTEVQPGEVKPVPAEQPDDPDRLARLNLEVYRKETGGELRFHRQQWFKWKSNRYQLLEVSDLRGYLWKRIKEEFNRLYFEENADFTRKVTSRLVSNVIAAMESHCLISSNVDIPCWLDGKCREKRQYVSMENGLLDIGKILSLKEEEDCSIEDVMFPHDHRWFSTFSLPYKFDPDARCPLWNAFLVKNFGGDKELIDLAQEWAGYLISPQNDMQKFLALEGDGQNGKSVFLSVMQALLGEENCSSVSLEQFADRFAMAQTLGKQANICADVGQIDIVAEGRLKSFVSADTMMFDRKNMAPVTCSPTAKLMCAWNNRPRISDSSSGPWRRMLLIPFRVKIQDHEVVSGMDKTWWWKQQGEMPGIFNWALHGAIKLRRQGKFTIPNSVRQSIEEYKIESNPILQFFQECVVAERDAEVASSKIYGRYKEWCDESGHRPFSLTAFAKELKRNFPESEKTRNAYDQISMTRQRGFKNVRLA